MICACVTASAVLTLLGSQSPSGAAEIRLLSAASIQEVFKEIIGDFERAAGHKLIINYDHGCVCTALELKPVVGKTQAPHQTVSVQALRNARFVGEIAHERPKAALFPA